MDYKIFCLLVQSNDELLVVSWIFEQMRLKTISFEFWTHSPGTAGMQLFAAVALKLSVG
jgi:hypothetical protein